MAKNQIHSVKYNFIMNFILTASQFVFPLITFPYISRVLQASGNGKISFVTSVSSYFVMFASLGIPTYGVRACAQIRDDRSKLSKTVQEIFAINFVMTIFVLIVYFLCIWFVPRFQYDKTLFLLYSISILLSMFGMNWLFQALEQYDYITARSIIFKIVSILLMFLLVHHQDDYIIYAAISVLASVGSNILNFFRVRKYIDFRWIGHYEIKKHIKPILVLFAQSLAVSIYTNLDTVMLGFMKTDVDVGYYNAAVKVKGILVSLVTCLGNVLLPRMSYYAKQKLYDEFKGTMVKALNFTVMMSVPLVTFFVLHAKETINLLAGEGYSGSILAMQIITIAVIPIGITGVLGIQVLTAIEKEKYVLYSVISGAIVDFLLNVFLIPKYAAAGAALSTTIAEFVVLGVQLIVTKTLLDEVKNNFRLIWYVLLSAISATFCIILKILSKNVNSFFAYLVVSAGIFFIIYGVGLILIREEIIINLLNMFRNRLKK